MGYRNEINITMLKKDYDELQNSCTDNISELLKDGEVHEAEYGVINLRFSDTN